MIRSPLAQEFILAPNIEPRRDNRQVDMLILHYTGMYEAAAALDLLCSPTSGVSCHYMVDCDGSIIQMVGEEMRAWHAGVSHWRGESDTNSRSVGIEIHNPGHGKGYPDFPEVQMAAVSALCHDILSRHDIPQRHVLAHSDVAPGRKVDPGEKFDWQRLAGEGIGLWVPPEPDGQGTPLPPEDLAHFQQQLLAFGYGISPSGLMDDATRKATDAFQRHFRPAVVDGLPDRSSLETLQALLRRAAACGTAP